MLAGHVLALVGVPMKRVIRITRDARDARYSLLRGYFHGADDDGAEELHLARLQSVTVPAGVGCVGASLESIALQALGVQVVSVRRPTTGVVNTPNDWILEVGDTLVLSGRPEALALAEESLLSP